MFLIRIRHISFYFFLIPSFDSEIFKSFDQRTELKNYCNLLSAVVRSSCGTFFAMVREVIILESCRVKYHQDFCAGANAMAYII